MFVYWLAALHRLPALSEDCGNWAGDLSRQISLIKKALFAGYFFEILFVPNFLLQLILVFFCKILLKMEAIWPYLQTDFII